MNDTLTRRRGFVPVDEYGTADSFLTVIHILTHSFLAFLVALHPGTDRMLFTHVPDGIAWIDEPAWIKNPNTGELEVLVRWLGDDIDMERLDEIKDIEYGRRSKEMQVVNRTKKAHSSVSGPSSAGRKN